MEWWEQFRDEDEEILGPPVAPTEVPIAETGPSQLPLSALTSGSAPDGLLPGQVQQNPLAPAQPIVPPAAPNAPALQSPVPLIQQPVPQPELLQPAQPPQLQDSPAALPPIPFVVPVEPQPPQSSEAMSIQPDRPLSYFELSPSLGFGSSAVEPAAGSDNMLAYLQSPNYDLPEADPILNPLPPRDLPYSEQIAAVNAESTGLVNRYANRANLAFNRALEDIGIEFGREGDGPLVPRTDDGDTFVVDELKRFADDLQVDNSESGSGIFDIGLPDGQILVDANQALEDRGDETQAAIDKLREDGAGLPEIIGESLKLSVSDLAFAGKILGTTAMAYAASTSSNVLEPIPVIGTGVDRVGDAGVLLAAGLGGIGESVWETRFGNNRSAGRVLTDMATIESVNKYTSEILSGDLSSGGPLGLLGVGAETAADAEQELYDLVGQDDGTGSIISKAAVNRALNYAAQQSWTPSKNAYAAERIIYQDRDVITLREQSRIYKQAALNLKRTGDTDQADEFFAKAAVYSYEADRLENMTPGQIADEDASFWREVIFGGFLDPLGVWGAAARKFNISPVNRRSAANAATYSPRASAQYSINATALADDVARKRKVQLELSQKRATQKEGKLTNQFRITAASEAERARFGTRDAGAFLRGVSTWNDADLFINKLLDDDIGALTGSLEGFNSPRLLYERGDSTGKVQFGDGAVLSESMQDMRQGLLNVKDEVLDYVARGSQSFNARAFTDALGELAYKGVLKERGVLAYDIPVGTKTVKAVVENGQTVLNYVDETGNIIRKRTDVPNLNDAKSTAKIEQRVANGFRDRQRKIFLNERIASGRRNLMSRFAMNMMPRTIIRHVAQNQTTLKADAWFDYISVSDGVDWIKNFYASDAISPRVADALDGQSTALEAQFGMPFGDKTEGFLKRLIPWSDWLRAKRTGLTEINGIRLDIGEDKFWFTQQVRGAQMHIERYAPDVMDAAASLLRQEGLPREFVDSARGKLLEASINGGPTGLSRAWSEIVNDGETWSLSNYGPYADVLTPDQSRRLNDIVVKNSITDPVEVSAAVDRIFRETTTVAARNMAETGIIAGRSINTARNISSEVGDAATTIRQAARNAGQYAEQVAQGVENISQQILSVHEEGMSRVTEAALSMDSPDAISHLLDVWRDTDNLVASRNQSQQRLYDNVIAQARELNNNNPAAMQAQWEQYYAEATELYSRHIEEMDSYYLESTERIRNGLAPVSTERWLELDRSMEDFLPDGSTIQSAKKQRIDLGRTKIRAERATTWIVAQTVSARTPGIVPDIMDILVSADRDIADIGLATRGRVENLREQYRRDAGKPGVRKPLEEVVNDAWDCYYRSAVERQITASKEMLLLERNSSTSRSNLYEPSPTTISPELDAELRSETREIADVEGDDLRATAEDLEDLFSIENGETMLEAVYRQSRNNEATGYAHNGPTHPTVARSIREHSDRARDLVIADATRAVPDVVVDQGPTLTEALAAGQPTAAPVRLTAQQRRKMKDAYATVIAPAYDNLLAAAAKSGDDIASFSVVDFTRGGRGIDNTIGMFTPYHSWRSREFKNMAERMITMPGYASKMQNYYGALQQHHENEDNPQRFHGRIPGWKTEDGGRKYLPDLVGITTLSNVYDDTYSNPDDEQGFARWSALSESFGFPLYPDLKIGVDYLSGSDDFDPSNIVGNLVPGTDLIGWGWRAMFDDYLPGTTPKYRRYYPKREAVIQAANGDMDSVTAEMVIVALERKEKGLAPLPEHVSLGIIALAEKIEKSTAKDIWLQRAASALLGINTTEYTAGERANRNAMEYYYNTGYDSTAGGSKAARDTIKSGTDPVDGPLLEDSPDPRLNTELDVGAGSIRPRIAANRARFNDPDAARPSGIDVSASEMKDEIFAVLRGVAQEAGTDLISGNPNAEKTEYYAAGVDAAITASWQSGYASVSTAHAWREENPDGLIADFIEYVQEAALDEEFPSRTKDFGNSVYFDTSRSPEEIAELAFKNIVKYSGAGKPVYPSKGSPDAVMEEYYDAIDKWSRNQIDIITAAGQAVVNDVNGVNNPLLEGSGLEKNFADRLGGTGNVTTSDAILAQMFSSQYATDIIRDVKNQYRNDIEAAYFRRLDIAQMAESGFYEEKNNRIFSEFGQAGIDASKAYNEIPWEDEDARAAFTAANPIIKQVWAVGNRPDMFEEGKRLFGEDIWALASSYPNYVDDDDTRYRNNAIWKGKHGQANVDRYYEFREWTKEAYDDFPKLQPVTPDANSPEAEQLLRQGTSPIGALIASSESVSPLTPEYMAEPDAPPEETIGEIIAGWLGRDRRGAESRVDTPAGAATSVATSSSSSPSTASSPSQSGTTDVATDPSDPWAITDEDKEKYGAEYDKISAHWKAYRPLDPADKEKYLRDNPEFYEPWLAWKMNSTGKTREQVEGEIAEKAATGAYWEKYNALDSVAAKAKFIRDNPGFHEAYLAYAVGKGSSNPNWWQNYTGSSSSGRRSSGGGGGGRSSSGGSRASSSYRRRVSTPRLSNDLRRDSLPWPTWRL